MKYALFIPLIPLMGFLITGIFRNNLSKTLSGIIGCGTVLISFILSLMVFNDVRTGGGGIIHMFDFIEAMNKLDSKHQQQVLNEGIKAEMLKSILKMQ